MRKQVTLLCAIPVSMVAFMLATTKLYGGTVQAPHTLYTGFHVEASYTVGCNTKLYGGTVQAPHSLYYKVLLTLPRHPYATLK
jgi:hypothetical protein